MGLFQERRGQKQISCDFVPQAFIKAYVDAWRKWADAEVEKAGGGGAGNAAPVFLVIEEINHGNCAQIFGDLFQLLDRNEEGYSEYAVDADADLARWLGAKLGGGRGDADGGGTSGGLIETALPVDVMSGKKLVLPPNLYIRATMNTSDQSLFPIDSAFKRRWDWEYVPIRDEDKGWYVKVGTDKYEWWSFLEKINAIVYEETQSAVLDCLGDAFEVAECPLGVDPSTKVTPHEPAPYVEVPTLSLTRHYISNYLNDYFLVGCIKNDGGIHRDWVFKTRSKYKRCSIYNVRLDDRPGAVSRSDEKVRTPKFVILYEEADDKCYRVFRVHHAMAVKKERMERMQYPHPSGDYFCYFLDEEVCLGELDVHKIRRMYKYLRDPIHAFAPLYISGKQLAAGIGE